MATKISKENVKTQLNPNLTNTDILNDMAKSGSLNPVLLAQITEPFENGDVTDADGNYNFKSGEKIADVFVNMPDHMNQFIPSLNNRYVVTMFFNTRWKNNLAVFQKGTLKLGEGIQQLFVGLGERKGFGQNFEATGGSAENNLIGKRVPKVYQDFIYVNGRYKYKVSVSIEQLQEAFINKNGLSQLANELIQSNFESAEVDNYDDMYNLLFSSTAIVDAEEGLAYDKGYAYQMLDAFKAGQTKLIVKCGTDPKELVKQIRTHVGKLSFKTADYNLSKIRTHTDKKKLVFLTTPEISANIDVNVLASAFNVSSAEITVRSIDVHELPLKNTASGFAGNVVGMLMDEDLVQFWYKLNTTRTFENGDTLTVNHFLHQWVINSVCKFCNAVIFTDEPQA